MTLFRWSDAIFSVAPRVLLAASLGGLAFFSHAQQVYRIVGPDGRVTFSDQPPANADAKVTTGVGARASGAPAEAALPFELRNVVSRYPVTLYTGDACSPCGLGRSLLAARGVPFTEKTVTSNEDAEALRRLSGDLTLPMLTVGGQQLKGFSDVEWAQFLDVAGYPKTSQLPQGYRNPPAAPLVATKKPDPAPSPAAAAAPAPSAAQPTGRAAAPAAADTGSNPAGIRF